MRMTQILKPSGNLHCGCTTYVRSCCSNIRCKVRNHPCLVSAGGEWQESDPFLKAANPNWSKTGDPCGHWVSDPHEFILLLVFHQISSQNTRGFTVCFSSFYKDCRFRMSSIHSFAMTQHGRVGASANCKCFLAGVDG